MIVRLEVSILETEMEPPERRFVIVRFEVSTLEALRVPPMKASLVTEFKLVIVRLEDWMLDVDNVPCTKRLVATFASP